MKLFSVAFPSDSVTGSIDALGRVGDALGRAFKKRNAYYHGPIHEWDPRVLAQSTLKVLTDTTYMGLCECVSTPFKTVIEKTAPDQCQFLPFAAIDRRTRQFLPQYWLMIPLYEVDVIHYERSQIYITEDGKRVPCGVRVLDPTRIPDGLKVFACKNYAALFTEPVWRAIRRERLRVRMTGYDIAVDESYQKLPGQAMSLKELQYAHGYTVPRFEPARHDEIVIPPRPPRRKPGESAANFVDRLLQAESATAHGPVTETDIAAAEARLAVRFPAAYREFVQRFGFIEVGSESIAGLGGRDDDNVVALTESFRDGDWQFPQSMIVIGLDGRGGCYCLNTARENAGETPVMYFDHELAYAEDGPPKATFERKAATLANWVQRLAQQL